MNFFDFSETCARIEEGCNRVTHQSMYLPTEVHNSEQQFNLSDKDNGAGTTCACKVRMTLIVWKYALAYKQILYINVREPIRTFPGSNGGGRKVTIFSYTLTDRKVEEIFQPRCWLYYTILMLCSCFVIDSLYFAVALTELAKPALISNPPVLSVYTCPASARMQASIQCRNDVVSMCACSTSAH